MSLYSTNKRESSRGVTLLEMLAVLAIISITIALLSPLLSFQHAGGAVHRDAANLAAALNYARSDAISGGRIVDFHVDTNRKKFGVSGAPELGLASDATIRFTGARELMTVDGVGVVRFYPDGSASGAEILVASERETDRIEIDWLDGLAHVERHKSK